MLVCGASTLRRTCLERFIEKVYNQQRLHSALGHHFSSEADLDTWLACLPSDVPVAVAVGEMISETVLGFASTKRG